ncbi:MAG: cytochrome c maturation protein CcmE [Coriobacteriia bacterium]|nr:cytochrome c maturation protein CcmE [Coriobacteriia bacterium]
MNSKLKRRLIAVTGVIVIAIVVVVTVLSASSGHQNISVAQAASGGYLEKRVEVTGQVVANSYYSEGSTLHFAIYDDSDPSVQLNVTYDGTLAATFGNEVTAICTGTINSDGVLVAKTLVTKCPSKYENSTDALNVSQLLGYGNEVIGTTVKITGTVKAGTLQPAGTGDRLVLKDLASDDEVAVDYDGAVPDSIQDGTAIVVTGSLGSDGRFKATDVSIKE